MALEEIKAKFVGKWKLDRSENFDDFLKEVGVSFPIRKVASLAKPVMEISIADGKVKIAMHMGFKDQVDLFKFDEEFEKEMDGNKLKAVVTWEEGKIKMVNTPTDPASKVKPQTVYREIAGEEMLLTIFCGDVVCKRYFKKVEG